MNEIEKMAVEGIAKVAPEIYSDALSGAMKQIGRLGEDALKTFRLALFPLQFTSALQDRLARYIDSAISKVPEQRRIAPQPSMAIQLCEKLRTFDDAEEFKNLYINLLARMMDKQRVGEAHPAFINIVSQLAPDEIEVIKQLAAEIEVGRVGRLLVLVREKGAKYLSYSEIRQQLDAQQHSGPSVELLLRYCLVPEKISQPELFFVFFEHLRSLGLAEFTNESELHNDAIVARKKHAPLEFFSVQLSQFGRLFHRACVAAEK